MSGGFEREPIGMGMSMSLRSLQEGQIIGRQEFRREGRKDEVISNRIPIPPFSQPYDDYKRFLKRYLHYNPYVVEVFAGLPNSGKSTVMSQRAAAVEEMLARFKKQTGRDVRLRSISWGDFIVPEIGGDISKIGHINDLQPKLSQRMYRELHRVIGRPNEYWMVEVPGVAERGESTLHDLVQNHGAFVDVTIADEELRQQKLAFREERQQVEDLEQLFALYRRHDINPNFGFDESALVNMSSEQKLQLFANIMAKVRRMGATPDGIRAVDRDVDDEMLQLVKQEQILLYEPGYPQLAGFQEEHWQGVLQHPLQRKAAVAQLYQIKLRDQHLVDQRKVFIGENNPVEGEKNVRMDVLKRAEVPIAVIGEKARIVLPGRRDVYVAR
jgi:hypothetical protein